MTDAPRAPDELDRLLDRLDVFDALDAMLFASCAGYRDRDGRHVTGVPSVLVEYVWARLLRRDRFEAITPSDDPVTAEALVTAALAAVAAEQGLQVNVGDGDDPSGLARSSRDRLMTQGIWAYDPAILVLEADRTAELLAPFGAEVERVVGAPLEHLAWLVGVLFRQRFERIARSGGVLDLRGDGSDDGAVQRAYARIREAAAQGVREQVLPGSGVSSMTTVRLLAADAGLPPEHVERLCDLLAGAAPGDDAHLPFDQLVWRLRRRPIARWGPFISAPLPTLLIPALRPAIETALRGADPAVGARYDNAKGRWLEARTIALARSLLPIDEGYRALELHAAEGTPERDAVLCVDLLGLAVEVKGVGLAPAARAGDERAQRRALERIVRRSARQAQSLAEALRDGEKVTGVSIEDDRRRPVDLRGVIRWIPLVVTLEDVGGVTAAYEAAFGGAPGESPVPVVLSLDDLAWYADELPLPAMLLHYFVVRDRIARSGAPIVVVDEADWFRLYLHGGAAALQETLDSFAGLPTQIFSWVSDRRRGLASDRGPAWRSPHEALLRRWQEEAEPGWLEASFALLDLSWEQSLSLAEGLRDALAGLVLDEDFAIVTIRPAGDPRTAVHVLASVARSGSIAMNDLAPLLWNQAPDATRRVVLGTRDGVVDHLHMLGIARIELPDDG